MTYEETVDFPQKNSNKKFNNNIINSKVPIIGCTLPFVRKLAKQFSVQQVERFPVHAYYEIDLLRGIVISTAKMPFEQKREHLAQFAGTIENWAVCDSSAVKAPVDEREKYFRFFCELLCSDKPFVCRYGVVDLLNYLDSEHIRSVFAQLKNIRQWGNYYVDMGVAWLVATAMAKCRDETVEYMEREAKTVLNKFAYNKALQKMRESYRVSEADKQWSYTQKII